MEIKIKNFQVRDFVDFLHGLPIKGAKLSRMRTRILRHASSYVSDKLVPELNVIVDKYAETEDGVPLINGNGGIEWKPETAQKAMEEMNAIDNEYYYLECDSFMKDAIIGIGEYLLDNEDVILEGNIATFFDGWCEQFELAIEHYAKREIEKEG